MPVPVIDCETVLEAGVEYYIDGSASSDNTGIAIYHFDFGDGTTSNEAKPIHVYAEVGTYTITLTVTDTDGNVATAEKQITVRPRGMLGSAKIRVVDQDGKAVPNAPVYFDLESEQQVVRNTDANGYVTFTAEVGKHLVGCVIANNSWLPVQKEIIVTAGAETEITLILVRHVMIEGQFEIKRMTFEEIEAEGIDVSKPENQHFVKVNLTLTYGTEKVDTVFRYNEITGETIAPPTIVPSDGGYRKIYPVVIPNPEEGGLTEESVIAYLDIPVGASALKEFFEVKLHILNHASEDFSMLDNVIELHLPEGLTLVDSYASADSTVVNIKEIKGQTAETITWHLRGDQIGEYHLTADYSGILSAFQTPVHVQFLSAEPVEVRGLSDLTLTAVLPETMENGVLHYNLELYNMGSTDIYLPDVTTDDLLLGAALLDPNGNDVTAAYGEPTALPAGYRLIYRYMQTADGDYADLILHLQEAVATFGDTYGMQIRMVSRPLDEIRSGLSVEIDRSAESGLSVRMTLEPRFAEDRQITFAVALYDEQGRMIDLRMAGETLKAEETLVSAWVSLTEANAHTVAVMAMDTQYVPILPLWTQTLK